MARSPLKRTGPMGRNDDESKPVTGGRDLRHRRMRALRRHRRAERCRRHRRLAAPSSSVRCAVRCSWARFAAALGCCEAPRNWERSDVPASHTAGCRNRLWSCLHPDNSAVAPTAAPDWRVAVPRTGSSRRPTAHRQQKAAACSREHWVGRTAPGRTAPTAAIRHPTGNPGRRRSTALPVAGFRNCPGHTQPAGHRPRSVRTSARHESGCRRSVRRRLPWTAAVARTGSSEPRRAVDA